VTAAEPVTHTFVICDECRTATTVTNEHARQIWQRNHTHDAENGSPDE
jgi:Fe2+ or Zn2+ uptake regulation protein